MTDPVTEEGLTVDLSALEVAGARIEYSFLPDGIEGLRRLYDFHYYGLVELTAPFTVVAADQSGTMGERAQIGSFINRLDGEQQAENRRTFKSEVAPHLKWMRVL